MEDLLYTKEIAPTFLSTSMYTQAGWLAGWMESGHGEEQEAEYF